MLGAFTIFKERNRFPRIATALFLVSLVAPCWSSSLELRVTPRVCVVSTTQPVCKQMLTFSWHSAVPLHFCVYEEEVTEPLQCWQQAREGEFFYSLITQTSRDFSAISSAGEVLSVMRVDVAVTGQKYRRARRNPWNFF